MIALIFGMNDFCSHQVGCRFPPVRLPQERPRKFLAQRFFDFGEPVGFLEDLAGLGTVRGPNDAILFHQVNEVSGATIADAQAALQQGSGGLAELDDEANGIFEELVMLAF